MTGGSGLHTMPHSSYVLSFSTLKALRQKKTLQHYRTIQALPLILGKKRNSDAVYLDSCRSKRNIVEYDYVGGVTGHDADELIEFVKELKADVLEWLNHNHPELTFKKKD